MAHHSLGCHSGPSRHWGSVESQRTEPTVTLPPWSIDEALALRQARTGDPEAFRELVSHLQAQVFGTALRLIGRRADAVQQAQEVFIALHGALPRISNPAHLQRWVSRAIEQCSADWLRQEARRGDVVIVENPGGSTSGRAEHQDAAADPGAEFTAGVMVRLEQRRSHRRQFSATRRPDRRSGRRILWGTALLAVLALALLGLHWAGLLWPVQNDVSAPVVAAATNEASTASLPAGDPPAPTDDASAVAVDSTAVPLAVKDLYPRYTMIVMPPRQESRDTAGIAAVAAFHDALLAALREVPGLTVLTPGLTAPPADPNHPADYLLSVTGLQVTALASGGVAFRVSGGEVGGAVATGSGQQWPVEIRVQPIGQPASGAFASALQVGTEDTAAAFAAQQVRLLRMRFFPDALVRQQLLERLSDAASSGVERDSALSELLDTPLRGRGPVLDPASIAVIVQQAGLMRADQRAQLWRSLRGYSWPELVEPLLDALRRDPEQDVRFEALATLAANHVNEARVRTVLESVAKEDPQLVVQMAARRALGGAAEWRDYVVATLADGSLSYEQRLAPLLLGIRSASLPAERLDVQGIARDAQVRDQLAAMVREGWFDAAQADAVGDALSLLADGGSTPTSALLVQVMPQGPLPAAAAVVPPPAAAAPAAMAVSPSTMAWLLSHRNNPLARRLLDGIVRGNPDPRLETIVEQLRRAEQMQRVPQRR
jgi:DNA-directed RNA polymerase specialized sigma24 family protein